MAAQPRLTPTMGRSSAGGDTTYTKIFVGGLAWETQHDTMRRYFEQFGEILEAVVIADKNTGRSKGYGFVTFKDPDSAMRACEDPAPVIDGRRANCNLASLGAAQRPRPPTPQPGMWRYRPAMGSSQASYSYRPATAAAAASSSTAYFHQPAQYAYTYPFYGYSGGYPQESLYPMSYYGIGRGQQHNYSPYYPAGPGIVHHSFHPYYPQYAHLGQMPQFPYLPQQYGSGAGIISLPTSIAATTAAVVTIAAPSSSQQPGAAPDLHPPA